MSEFPRCGLYKTTQPLADAIAPGRLVYFHNHGEPGPGVYLPSGWVHNRATWHTRGTTVRDVEWAKTLEPLAPEGLYRVLEPFECCARKCRAFEAELLVQLGYNGAAEPILFVPEWTHAGLAFPMQGTPLDRANISKLKLLQVAQAAGAPSQVH